MASGSDHICSLCRYPGSDIRLIGCGCTLHARCTPLSLVLDVQQQDMIPSPNTSNSTFCPVCRAGTVKGIHLVPLTFTDLERSITLRKASFSEAKSSGSGGNGKKSSIDGDSPEMHSEAAYLVLSNSRSSLSGSSISDREQQRTGRWTDEEIAFVDYLVAAFDRGSLPLPHGIKLNEFLGDMLICKSSRLTKKMKNAKLSTRSFMFRSPMLQAEPNEHAVLSSFQEKFLMSIPSEPTQLELRFNLTKQWRMHFSNLCVQIGYPYLDGKDWVASLEEMERRASNAEELIRRVRRKRMSQALQTDGGISANSSVFIGRLKADSVASQGQPIMSLDIPQAIPEEPVSRKLSTSEDDSERPCNADDDMLAMLEGLDNDETGEPPPKRPRARTFSEEIFLSDPRKPRSFSEDFDAVLSDLMDPEPPSTTAVKAVNTSEKSKPNHSCGPFLDAITMFMESKNLPFQHADVWVPSFLPRDSKGPSMAVDTEQLRLFHAGYATRGDLEEELAYSFNEFGVYSDNFSFEPGHGLPGRVYSSGELIWECRIDESDPKLFERAGGAKVYGVKTAVGIPLCTPLVGRIVVAMYSSEIVAEDMAMAQECARELMRYSPEPKWKLVIEMKDETKPMTTVPKRHRSEQPAENAGSKFGGLQAEITQGSSPPSGTGAQLVECTSPNAPAESPLHPEEQRIVTLLGEHMSMSDGSSGEPTSSAGNSTNLLTHIMLLRLLLLRPSGRRSAQENEMIDVLKNSFRAYAKSNRRSGAELANLLAKDWMCLKATYAGSNTPMSDPSLSRPMMHGRRGSSSSTSTDAALMQTHTQLMQSSYGAQPATGPMMNPPSQFISPPDPLGGYRQTSMGIMSSRSAFSQDSQGMLQPQSILSSRPQRTTNSST